MWDKGGVEELIHQEVGRDEGQRSSWEDSHLDLRDTIPASCDEGFDSEVKNGYSKLLMRPVRKWQEKNSRWA